MVTGNRGEQRLVAQGAETGSGVPSGMVRQTPGSTATTSSRSFWPPPHLTAAGEKKPDLFDRAVGNGFGRLAGLEFKMRHAAALQAQ